MMLIQKQPVFCLSCQKNGEVEFVVNAPFKVAIASMRAARCPSCGSPELALGFKEKAK